MFKFFLLYKLSLYIIFLSEVSASGGFKQEISTKESKTNEALILIENISEAPTFKAKKGGKKRP